MRLLTNILFLSTLLLLGNAIPRTKRDVLLNQNYFASTSQILATSLLKDNIDIDGNHVHAPLGIATVLAILAEGSRGETYNEFTTSIGFPADKEALRDSARAILKNLNSVDLSSTPAFKTWFYIYKNNTVKDEYKEILRDYYMAEVKDIERSEYAWSGSQINDPMNNNSKDIIGFETLKKSENFEDLQKSYEAIDGDIEEKKEASKFDKVVDDKQYVEVPVIKEEIAKEQQKQQEQQELEQAEPGKQQDEQENGIEAKGEENKDAQPLIDIKDSEDSLANDEDNETIREAEKKEELKKGSESTKSDDSSEPERISIPLKKLDELEVLQTVENEFPSSRLHSGRSLLLKDDITSALSANSLIGDDKDGKTKILLFNGLYFRSNWRHPFKELRNGPEDVFYVNQEESLPVTMMRNSGDFRTTRLEELKSQAVELPYDDNLHSLLIIVPDAKDGLRHLIQNLKTDNIASIRSRLAPEQLSICLPRFKIDCTSRSEATLKSLGLQKIFLSEEADLRDITEDARLHVDEIVQHVNIKVDEGTSTKDALTAGAETRIVEEYRSIVADRPFLYFVLHNESNFVLVVGKIMTPEQEE